MYSDQKDNCINRSFKTNKFYMFLVLLLILTMYYTKDLTFSWGLSSTIVFSIAGMFICVLWWSNMDSYNMLTKVKFGNVIEELEKQLPAKPFQMEFEAIKDF